MRVVSFQQLAQEKYFAIGLCQEDLFVIVRRETGLSKHAFAAALKGTCVAASTAQKLAHWAAATHKVELDKMQLMEAPPRPQRTGDPGKRAEELIEAAAQEAQMPPELACIVAMDLESGLWRVTCRDRLGGGLANEQCAPELTEALRAVRDEHYGRRSA